MAPELIHESKYGSRRSRVSKEGDIYALGMVVYEVVTGVRPFGVENIKVEEIVRQVLSGARPTSAKHGKPGIPLYPGYLRYNLASAV